MIRLALDRPVSTIVATAAAVVLGLFALAQLPVSLLPEMQRAVVVVDVTDETRSRDEILAGVTEPLERLLASVEGVESIRSETRDGRAIVRVQPEWQADADRLLVEVARLAAGAGEGTRRVAVTVAPPDAAPVADLVVTGGAPAEREELATRVLRPELARLSGAGRIDVAGATTRRAVVRPRLASLAARGATVEDLASALRRVGEPVSAGSARDGVAERPLVIVERVASEDALRALLVVTPRGSVALGDVADVSIEDESGESVVRHGGEDAVLVRAWRAPGANAIALAGDVRALASSVRGPSGLRVTVVSDRSGEIAGALRELFLAALSGIALGTVVLRVMLGRWAPTLSLMAVSGASVLAAFAAFRVAGVPLDVVSLSGLALASGMLVDNAIVVAEAIETARARGAERPALDGTRRVAVAVVASCATTVVVFVPFLYLNGLARAFFGEQAFAVVATLSASLLLALTLTPVLAERLAGARGVAAGISPGRETVRRLLAAFLARPAAAVALGVALAALTVAGVAWLPRQLFGEGASREVAADIDLPPGLTPAEARRRMLEAESAVREALGTAAPGALVTIVQGLADGAGLVRSEAAVLRVELPDASGSARAREAIDEALRGVPGLRARVRLRPGAFVEALGDAGGLEVIVTAGDDAAAGALARAAAAAIQRETGLVAREPRSSLPTPAVTVTWDPVRLAALGADAGLLDRQVEAALRREPAGRLDVPGVEAPRLEIPDGEWTSLPIRVPLPAVGDGAGEAGGTSSKSQVVPLRALAQVAVVAREPGLEREGLQPCRRLVVPEASRAGLRDLERAVASVRVAAGERVRLGGEAWELERAFSQLRFALVLSVILSFLAIAVAYESLVLPLLIMTTVPIAAGGGLALLLATGQSFGLMAFIGVIVIGGIAVNNAIVLVDRVEVLRSEGVPETTALLAAASERWRPILMTTLTTLLGALPLAVLGGDGAELRRPLALVMIGGLLTSTLASVLVVPVLHAWLDARGLLRRRSASGP